MLAPDTRTRIESLLGQNRIVLFMKGTRHAPRCGFSAGTANLLNELSADYASFDVLEDADIREGIKEFGNWPTIPQLYVDKELVGGADIVQGMYNSGELHELLGLPKPDRTPPDISISDAAAAAIRAGLADAGDAELHLAIDARFAAQFMLRPAQGSEIRAVANGIEILFDAASAARARGIAIDWVETPQGAGLSITNPNAPKPVQPLAVGALQQRLGLGDITVIDVRPPADRALAPFAAARVLDEDSLATLAALPKDTALAFLCHHGNSSRSAAEHFRSLGFRDVYNVDGGIDAWSREIDPAIPRY
jgi:monothiol glutaredoxin